jgi:hypothetical protein
MCGNRALKTPFLQFSLTTADDILCGAVKQAFYTHRVWSIIVKTAFNDHMAQYAKRGLTPRTNALQMQECRG